MSEMVERVARAIAFSQGARMVGPWQSAATREFGWKGDGEHFEEYVEAHWSECVSSAQSAITAMGSLPEGVAEIMSAHASNGMVDWRDLHSAMISAALE